MCLPQLQKVWALKSLSSLNADFHTSIHKHSGEMLNTTNPLRVLQDCNDDNSYVFRNNHRYGFNVP